MKAGAVIQARMGSRRLPGKALADLAGRPLLERVVERVRRARNLAFVGVATSDQAADDAIEGFCTERGIPCLRGPEGDVLGRITLAARHWELDPVVRITGDCPFVCPELIDELVEQMQSDRADVATLFGPSLHEGIDPFSRRVLEYWNGLRLEAGEREHLALLPESRSAGVCVTGRPPRPEEAPLPGIRLSVDEPHQLAFARSTYLSLLGGSTSGAADFTTADLVAHLAGETATRTGGHLVAEALRAAGIPRLHLYPGGTIMPTLNAWIEAGGAYVVARHEQGAGYAALAEARLCGEPRAVLVTSGPGVTNLMTVIADAWYDGTPLLALTGQVGTADLASRPGVRQRGFQEVPTSALCAPIAKACLRPMQVSEIPTVMAEALATAREGRPGPVVIELPMDVQRGPVTASAGRATLRPARETKPRPDPDATALLADWIREAQRPVILAGQGTLQSGAGEGLRRLAEREQIPVATSLLGVGALPGNHELCLGFVGHTGTGWANRAVHECDLLLVLGARLDVRQTGSRTDGFAAGARIARIDLDPDELAAPRIHAQLSIRADVALALGDLEAALDRRCDEPPSRDAWQLDLKTWRRALPLDDYPAGAGVHPAELLRHLDDLTRDDAQVVVTGVGHHQQWAARHMSFDEPRRSLLTSGGHGAMGYDLPSAVGACLARPDSRVLCVVGDGSFQINGQELGTLVEHRLPAKIVVLDNRRLAMVSQFQKITWGHDPGTGDRCAVDFAGLAAAHGLPAFRLERWDDGSNELLRSFLAEPGPALLWVTVDPVCEVTPMLLAGQTLDAMWPWSEE